MANDKSFNVQVLTPEGPRFEGEITSITVPGVAGRFEMLYNHAPIVSSLGPGRVDIQKEDGSNLSFAVNGGFVEMSDNHVTLLAEKAIKPEDIDVEKAREELATAKNKIKESNVAYEDVEKDIREAESLIKIAGE